MQPSRDWSISDRRLRLGPHLFVSLQRSVRLMESTPAPPRSHGAAPIWKVDDVPVPDRDADVLVSVGEDEALWIGLEPADDRLAVAIRVAVETAGGGDVIDAVTGVTWHDVASASPQSYVVSPPQWALYGIADGMGRARQFVGEAGAGDNGGGVELLRLMCVPPLVVDPRPLPAVPEPVLRQERPRRGQRDTTADRPDGDALVPQPILPDPYGFQHWDFEAASAVRIRFVSPEEFERRSGLPRPAPLDPAETYQGRRLP